LISHFQPETAGMTAFHLRPFAYTDAWLLCAFSVFAVAYRYVRGGLHPLVPWLVAAGAALLIHLRHRPFYLYYNVHLIAPFAALGAIGLLDLGHLVKESLLSGKLRLFEARIIAGAVFLLAGIWLTVSLRSVKRHFDKTFKLSATEIEAQLRSLRDRGETAFSYNPIWTFSAHMTQTPPELTFASLKRFWSKQLSEEGMAEILLSNRVGGAVLTSEMPGSPAWREFLNCYAPVARLDSEVLYLRKDLPLKEINLNDQSDLYIRLGLRPGRALEKSPASASQRR
jgi:hypothetical protein